MENGTEKKEKGKEHGREYGIVVWGATGFTGGLVAEYIAKEYGTEFPWAIAGRDATKLNALSKRLTTKYANSLKSESIPIIIADSNNLQSLIEMTSRTEVIITTVGPFSKFGSHLIEACIQTQTHYTDTTGESWWVKKMIQQHHEEAQKQHVYIINFCGLDCLPADLSAFFLTSQAQKLYSKSCTQVKGYVHISGNLFVSGGTSSTILDLFESPSQSKGFRKPFFLNSSPLDVKKPTKFERDQITPVFDSSVSSWTKPSVLALADNRVVRRTQELLMNTSKDYGRNFQFNETHMASSYMTAWLVILVLGLFFVLMSIRFTRELIKKYVLPAPGKGPSEESRARVSFQYKTRAKIEGPTGNEPKVITSLFKCGEPGYTETAKMITESAICILKSRSEFELKGGVLTPAACMGEQLIQRLCAKGFVFTLVNK